MRKTIFCLIMLGAPASAQIIGGSNIGLSQYPAPNCSKPQVPVQPAATVGDKENPDAFNAKVRSYNKQVAGYNDAMKGFNDCMHSYVENGNADMQRIKQELDQAVAAANAR
jgi:hypothetical protein